MFRLDKARKGLQRQRCRRWGTAELEKPRPVSGNLFGDFRSLILVIFSQKQQLDSDLAMLELPEHRSLGQS